MTENKDRILMVLTSSARMGNSGKETGFWLSEFAGPFFALKDAGYAIEVASVRGGETPIDPRSKPGIFSSTPDVVRRYSDDEFARNWVRNTLPLDSVSDEYRAIVLVGGHGTMWDFPYSEHLSKLLVRMNDRGAVIGAICHGPAAFVGAIHPSGESVIGKRTITCFSDTEERELKLDEKVPFLLESKLRGMGINVEVGSPNSSTVRVDGNLITGQNSFSVHDFSQALLAVLHQQNISRGGDLGQEQQQSQQQQQQAGA